MEIDLVGEGLKFMVLGMLVVLVFLVILVQVMKLQAKIINKFLKISITLHGKHTRELKYTPLAASPHTAHARKGCRVVEVTSPADPLRRASSLRLPMSRGRSSSRPSLQW